jgi:hypothetical protein
MKQGARIVACGGALWLALGAAGCATTPAPPSGTVTSPMPGHAPESVHPADTSTGAIPTPPQVPPPMQVGTTASGGPIVQTGSPSDSGPSADARAVLSTIPDPVPGSETGQATPAPAGNAGSSGSAGAAGTPAAGGTAGAGGTDGAGGTAGLAAGAAGAPVAARPDSAGADTSSVAADSSSVPTPSLTEPLGEHPGGHVVTDIAAPVGPPPTATAQAPPPANPAPAGPCWRVQVAAVPEQARAKALREAAQSQLMTDMVIVLEKKLYKVRTKDCLSTEAADRIKQRAIDDGFSGAFRYKPAK